MPEKIWGEGWESFFSLVEYIIITGEEFTKYDRIETDCVGGLCTHYKKLSPRENGSVKYNLMAVSIDKNYRE